MKQWKLFRLLIAGLLAAIWLVNVVGSAAAYLSNGL